MNTMLKFLVLLICLAFANKALSQSPITPTPHGGWTKPNNSYGPVQDRISVGKALLFPTACGDPDVLNATDLGQAALYFDSCANTLWKYSPSLHEWSIVGSGSAGIGARWEKSQYVIGNGESPIGGSTTVTIPFAVQPKSEIITYQGVTVPKYPSNDFWYDVDYDSTSTVYTFRDPLTDAYALNIQYSLADSSGEGGGGGGGGSTGDADSLGGLPASSYVQKTRAINTTTPLSGSGTLASDITLSIADGAADGSTKGAVGFSANDFNSSSGIITPDYTNTQKATTSTNGVLTSTDWNTFNNKVGVTSPANGNIVYYNSGWQKLPIGTSKQTLHVVGGVPVWKDTIDYNYTTLTDGATITLDGNNGINFKVTLGGNRTLAVSNIVVGKVYTIEVNQDATGNRHLTLPANSLVANGYGSGTSIILSTGSLDKDQISFRYDGTNYLWTASLDYQ